MKICKSCKIEKPLDSYWKASKTRDGKQHECISCMKERRKAWKAQNPNYSKEWYQKNRESESLKQKLRKYGMSLDDFIAMLDAQDHQCAICHEHHDEVERGLYIDHDHTTGKVRGLLCHRCNAGIGFFRDSVQYLEDAAEYLRVRG